MAKGKGQEVGENPTPDVNNINNDGFVKGQEVSPNDYFAFIAKQRKQKKEENQGE